MPVDLVIKNAKIFTKGDIIESGLAIEGDKIVRIAKETNLPAASKEIDLKGFLVLPGLIDAHVHMRDQELAYKEDFFSGTAAAANGGVTLAIDMPNNKPETMSRNSLRERMRIASRKSIINQAFYSSFPERGEEIKGIIEEGAKAFKLFMSQKVGGLNPNDGDSLLAAFSEVAKLDSSVSVHAEDSNLLEQNMTKVRKEGRNDTDAYLEVHSSDVEVDAIEHAIRLTEQSNARLHICHLSTSDGVNIVSSAKKTRLPTTCEVTPHHLLLTSNDAKSSGAIALTNPPVRTRQDMQSLWSALQTGLIDLLVSDHAPHAIQEKERRSIWNTAPGISGIETMLPLMLTQVNKGYLSIPRLVQMASEKAAEIFRLRKRGHLREGYHADLVVIDMKKEWKVDSSKFHSKAKYSPFEGWRVKGKPIMTFVNGYLAMKDGEILAKPGNGQIVK